MHRAVTDDGPVGGEPLGDGPLGGADAEPVEHSGPEAEAFTGPARVGGVGAVRRAGVAGAARAVVRQGEERGVTDLSAGELVAADEVRHVRDARGDDAVRLSGSVEGAAEVPFDDATAGAVVAGGPGGERVDGDHLHEPVAATVEEVGVAVPGAERVALTAQHRRHVDRDGDGLGDDERPRPLPPIR